jgi:DNA polymerase epsilon subunit 4
MEATEDVGLTLPISKIKKIIKLDPEHISSTESANYVLGIATEMFIKQLTVDSSSITKSKGRKKIMYNDLQQIVNSVDVYAFMRDIVPKRAPIGELLNKGLIKLRPGDQERITKELEKEGYVEEGVDIEMEVDADAEVVVEAEREGEVEGEKEREAEAEAEGEGEGEGEGDDIAEVIQVDDDNDNN